MSATSVPIPPDVFAAAITELPLSALFTKAAEIRNSIAHLRRSNEQMAEFVTSTASSQDMANHGGDPELMEAMKENEDVIARMMERLNLLKVEVEGRGIRWVEPGSDPHVQKHGAAGANGDVDGDGEAGIHL